MAIYNSLEDAMGSLDHLYRMVSTYHRVMENELIDEYESRINEKVPELTGQTIESPSNNPKKRNPAKFSDGPALAWNPYEMRTVRDGVSVPKYKRYYVGYIYPHSLQKFRKSGAMHQWDLQVAIPQNRQFVQKFNDMLIKYIP